LNPGTLSHFTYFNTHFNSWRIKEPTWCHLLFYFTSYVLNVSDINISVIRNLQAEASFSLQHGHHSNPTAPNLQHTAKQEQNDQCGNSTA
jgi:hypothetical protein